MSRADTCASSTTNAMPTIRTVSLGWHLSIRRACIRGRAIVEALTGCFALFGGELLTGLSLGLFVRAHGSWCALRLRGEALETTLVTGL